MRKLRFGKQATPNSLDAILASSPKNTILYPISNINIAPGYLCFKSRICNGPVSVSARNGNQGAYLQFHSGVRHPTGTYLLYLFLSRRGHTCGNFSLPLLPLRARVRPHLLHLGKQFVRVLPGVRLAAGNSRRVGWLVIQDLFFTASIKDACVPQKYTFGLFMTLV